MQYYIHRGTFMYRFHLNFFPNKMKYVGIWLIWRKGEITGKVESSSFAILIVLFVTITYFAWLIFPPFDEKGEGELLEE